MSVKPLPFCPNNPSFWFKQLESKFNTAGVDDDDIKFWYVVAHVGQLVRTQVIDLVSTPPETDKYNSIKSVIIERLERIRDKKKILIRNESIDTNDSITQMNRKIDEMFETLNRSIGQIDERIARLETIVLKSTIGCESPILRPQHSDPSNSHQSAVQCWYHQTYGPNANRCRQPCSQSSVFEEKQI